MNASYEKVAPMGYAGTSPCYIDGASAKPSALATNLEKLREIALAINELKNRTSITADRIFGVRPEEIQKDAHNKLTPAQPMLRQIESMISDISYEIARLADQLKRFDDL